MREKDSMGFLALLGCWPLVGAMALDTPGKPGYGTMAQLSIFFILTAAVVHEIFWTLRKRRKKLSRKEENHSDVC